MYGNTWVDIYGYIHLLDPIIRAQTIAWNPPELNCDIRATERAKVLIRADVPRGAWWKPLCWPHFFEEVNP